jgi:hypothetical protein
MTCAACARENAANRRYCGGCGANLAPTCSGCSFVNASDDRYCGGCGRALVAGSGASAAATPAGAPSPAPARRTRTGVEVISQEELEELLAAPAGDADDGLPSGTIGQDDLDRLFGEPSS